MAKLEKEGRAAITLKKISWLLDFTKNHFANRPISEIEALEILVLLRELEATGKCETTRRMRSLKLRIAEAARQGPGRDELERTGFDLSALGQVNGKFVTETEKSCPMNWLN